MSEEIEVYGNRAQSVIESGNTMMQVKTAYSTAVAVQKPRSLSKMLSDVLNEADQAGSSFYYRWEAGGKEIIGGSIDMAASIFRAYGNCAMEINCNETATHYFFTATMIDLENGMSWPRMHRQRKGQSISRKMDQDRQEDIVFQIGQSKAMRNAILSVMPRWIVDRATEQARNAEIKKLSGKDNIEMARASMLRHFGKLGVSKDRIEAKLGKRLDDTSPDDLADLRSVATAIKDGMTTVSDAFPVTTEKQEPAPEEVPPWSFEVPDDPSFEMYVQATLQANRSTLAKLRQAANANPENFMGSYRKWFKANVKPADAPEKAPETTPVVIPETPAQSNNVFDNREMWVKCRTNKDGLSSFFFRNKNKWDGASDETKRLFAEKWLECYPTVPFPGTMPPDVEPTEASTPPKPESTEATPSREPGQEQKIRGEIIEMVKQFFNPETVTSAKKELGFGEADGTWPPSVEGMRRLAAKCDEIERSK